MLKSFSAAGIFAPSKAVSHEYNACTGCCLYSVVWKYTNFTHIKINDILYLNL